MTQTAMVAQTTVLTANEDDLRQKNRYSYRSMAAAAQQGRSLSDRVLVAQATTEGQARRLRAAAK